MLWSPCFQGWNTGQMFKWQQGRLKFGIRTPNALAQELAGRLHHILCSWSPERLGVLLPLSTQLSQFLQKSLSSELKASQHES